MHSLGVSFVLLSCSCRSSFGWVSSHPFNHDSIVSQPRYASVVNVDHHAPEDEVTTEPSRGALSMTIDELTEKLGGRGRAQLAWDCYSIGVDPHYYYDNKYLQRRDANDPGTGLAGKEQEEDDYDQIFRLLPTCRRTQRLGREALRILQQINGGLSVENGIATLSHVSRSADLTTKLLLRLADGTEVETVIIPWNGMRSTLCISSQVGCRQGCKFCATGRMGKLRSLTSDEILAQMFFARKWCRLSNGLLPPITNVVFMGMGEPADNAEEVVRAARILTTRELFQQSATRVTVSTVAPTPQAFSQLGQAPCVLAWSVHAANDDLRRQLVPTTRYTMAQLREGLMDALRQRPVPLRTTMLEVALLSGVNDSLENADELAGFARVIPDSVPGCKLVVNLIPYNDIDPTAPGFCKPTKERVVAFQKRLWQRGVYAHVRTTRGDDESAACGQLATQKKKTTIATP